MNEPRRSGLLNNNDALRVSNSPVTEPHAVKATVATAIAILT